MKLTKNDLKQLIQEMMEAEEMEAEVGETEDGSGGKIRIQARLRTDDAFKAAQEETEARGAGQNTFQMAEYVVTFPDGTEMVIPDNQTFEKMLDERAIEDAFTLAAGKSLEYDRSGYNLPSPETKIEGFKGVSQPGGMEDGELKDRDLGDFQVFIDGFEIPKQGAASEDLIKAFKKYEGREPRYRSSVARPVSRRRADDEYHDSRRDRRSTGGSYRPFKRFEEGKLTKSKLFQIIKEEISSMIQEQDIEDLHDKAVEIGSFWDKAKGQLDAVCRDPDMSPVDCKAVKRFYDLLNAHPVTKAMATYDLPKAAFYKHYFSVFTPAVKNLDPSSHKAQIEEIAQNPEMAKPGRTRRRRQKGIAKKPGDGRQIKRK